MIRAIMFDLDNTLHDFMTMKSAAVTSAVDAMIDAGLAYNKAAFVAAIAGQVQINSTDPDRVDMVLTPQLIRQFRTLAAQIQFIL